MWLQSALDHKGAYKEPSRRANIQGRSGEEGGGQEVSSGKIKKYYL